MKIELTSAEIDIIRKSLYIESTSLCRHGMVMTSLEYSNIADKLEPLSTKENLVHATRLKVHDFTWWVESDSVKNGTYTIESVESDNPIVEIKDE